MPCPLDQEAIMTGKFANTLDSNKRIIRSMSFFKTLRSERIYGNKLMVKAQMEMDLFEYIENMVQQRTG